MRLDDSTIFCNFTLLWDTEPKLLKPGRSYPIGRKARHPLQIVINHPKISHEHVTFSVGAHSVDDLVSHFHHSFPTPEKRRRRLKVE